MGLRANRDVELSQEAAYATFDGVADGPHRIDALTGRIGQFPVLVALAGEDRAGVTAAHGDDDVGGLDDLVGPGFGDIRR